MFKKLGGKRPYARFLNLNQRAVIFYHRGYNSKNKVKQKQSIPIWVFKKSAYLIDKELKEKLESNIFLLKARGGGIPVINPKLPLEESPAFYRVVAHVIGDGFAGKRKIPYYANTCKELREQFKKDLNIFGKVKPYERKPNTTPIIYFPKVVTDILSYILKINFTNPNHLPKQIFYASEECKSAFLRALFDDEGTMSTNLAVSLSDLNIIKEIGRLIEDIGIKTNKITIKPNKPWKANFSLSIKRKYLKEFKEKVGFSHSKKMRNLELAINTQDRVQRTRAPEEIKQKIIESLKNRKMRTLELANKIQLTLGYTLQFLKIMEKEGKIKRDGFRNIVNWSLLKA